MRFAIGPNNASGGAVAVNVMRFAIGPNNAPGDAVSGTRFAFARTVSAGFMLTAELVPTVKATTTPVIAAATAATARIMPTSRLRLIWMVLGIAGVETSISVLLSVGVTVTAGMIRSNDRPASLFASATAAAE